MPYLSDALNNSIYVKREDLSHEIVGGNKVRKLLYTLKRTFNKKNIFVLCPVTSTTPLLLGALQHQFNYRVETFLFKKGLCPQWTESHVRLNAILGNRVHVSPYFFTSFIHLLWRYFGAIFRFRELPVVLPQGMTTSHTSLGYALMCAELRRQIEQGSCPEPDYIVVPVGTGGTIAGIVAGVGCEGLKSIVVGIPILKKYPREKKIRAEAQKVVELLDRENVSPSCLSLDSVRLVITDDFPLCQYGATSPEMEGFRKKVHEHTTINFDPVYSGKTLWGLKKLIERDCLRGRSVLFIHTWDARPHLNIDAGEIKSQA